MNKGGKNERTVFRKGNLENGHSELGDTTLYEITGIWL